MSSKLEGKVARGAMIKLLGSFPMQLLSLATTLLCVKLLTPASFGAYGLAGAIYGVTDMVTNPAIGTYLIRNTKIGDRTIDVGVTLSALRGMALTPIMFLLAPYVTALFDGPQMTVEILQVQCFGLLVVGFRNLHTIRWHHRLEMGTVLLVEATGLAIGNLLSLGLLFYTSDPISMAIGHIAGHTLTTIATWIWGPRRPRFVFDKAEIRTMWKFTRFLVANAVIIYALVNLDDLLVGKLAGIAALGLYRMSYDWVNSSVLFIIRPLHDVVLPALANVTHDRKRLTNATTSVISVFSAISWMVCASTLMFAEELFAVLGGDDWSGGAPIFLALLPFVLIRGINGSMGQLMLAVGKPRILTVISGTQLAFMIPAALAGFWLDQFLGLVIAITILNGGAMVALLLVSPRYLDASAGRLFAILLAPLPAALAAVGATWAIEMLTATPWLRLVVGVPAGVIAFGLVWEAICRAPLGGLTRASISKLLMRVLRGEKKGAADAALVTGSTSEAHEA